jgi:hypothetical protein
MAMESGLPPRAIPAPMPSMIYRWLFTVLYGLHVIWTGLLRNIETRAYHADALWFCLTMGVIALAAAFLFRAGRTVAARVVGTFAVAVVLSFYLYCLIKVPAEDATLRVGLIILSSIAEVVVIFLPALPRDAEK